MPKRAVNNLFSFWCDERRPVWRFGLPGVIRE
jgi:hypothetical protein